MPTLPVPFFAALVLGFAVLRLWREQQRLGPLVLLLGLCAIQSMIIALAQHYMIPQMRWAQPVTASLIPPLAWIAYLDTTVRALRRSDFVHGIVPVVAVAIVIAAPSAIDVFLPAVFTLYGAVILFGALQGPDMQPRSLLSHGSMPGRIWIAIGSVLIASALSDVIIIAALSTGYGWMRPWIITVFSVGNLLIIGILGMSSYLRGAPTQTQDPPPAPAEPDAEIWRRVTEFMEQEKPYLDPDLTLSKLSRRLRIPAKELSTTINRAAGENVSRFVNNARIAEAQRRLRQGESVTNAMFASGFNTKSNFNREFLRVAGTNPTDWLSAQQPPRLERTGVDKSQCSAERLRGRRE